MSEKMTGYALLIIGIIIIAFAALNVYSVFTKKTRPAELFDFPSVTISSSALIGGSMSQEDLAKLPVKITPSDVEILPADILNQTSNILAHLLLMGFIAGIGSRFANIGVSLVRRIEVKLRPEITPTQNGK